ncbi:cobalamin biosynthesis protein CobW [Microvirga tunisiensis]|uniref:Cobalamin biosynthesis protein CobW n=2 Tax=Pannonibacter tanglangensis TaxID=2750084 RepID=A0A7X5J7U7_9HYPH|nr:MULTISPECIES: cobalamin biosynthesis protein CobW [unclassified Pannonibacter]NBN62377.1 cobalamin biosynthesis protein CobW [Pannonibacter sp. XCT-34]NBN78044.1 cobalamin biosynthesis protein CobW [Pannonibacter sp. XCT-53]
MTTVLSQGGKIPATIVTGFLGAGKTTLIRNLLLNAGGRRIALIVNEFGDMGFDGSLLDGCVDPSCSADDVVELTNGCICCTVADDFLPTMEMLLARETPPDHIVIETSGLALPQPLVRAFSWPSVKTRVTVDGVITVLDAAALAEGRIALDEEALEAQRAADASLDHDNPVEELFHDQLACADLVVLNKADLVDADQLAHIREHITEDVRSGVEIIHAEKGNLPVDVLLGRSAAAEDDLAARRAHHHHHHDHDDDHDHDHDDDHDHDHDDDDHDHHHDDFESHVLPVAAFASLKDLEQAVARAMALPGVLRIKGAASVTGKAAPALVQAVGPRVETWFAAGARMPGHVVVIGLKGLDLSSITEALGKAKAA